MYYSLHPRFMLNGKALPKDQRRLAFWWLNEEPATRQKLYSTEAEASAVADTAPLHIKSLLAVCETIPL